MNSKIANRRRTLQTTNFGRRSFPMRCRFVLSLLILTGLFGSQSDSSRAAATVEHQQTATQSPAALALRLSPFLPELAGLTAPATYLVLVQNNDELRPTGGFISAVGTITLEKARITEMEFVDSYRLFNKEFFYPPAPRPMQRYMQIPLLLLRDANWSPDLPTTAKLIQALYTRETGRQINGIITVDLRAVELLITALEPLDIEGAEGPITGATVIEQIKQLYSVPATLDADIETAGLGKWWGRRKEFIPTLAEGIRARLEGGDANLLRVVAAAQTALNERAIQIWLKDRAALAEVADLGWDGGLHPEPGRDFLAVVDTNMGYNKVDAVLKRQLAHTVTWPGSPGEAALATTTITYTHPLQVSDEVCEATARYGSAYGDMTKRCYFDYVRVYVPAGSKLITFDGVDADSVSSQRGEANTQVFAGYFMLPPASEHVVTLHYTLPAELRSDDYAFVLQRQSGTGALPFALRVGEQTWTTSVESGRIVWPPAP